MNSVTTYLDDHEAISRVVQTYIDGAISGKSAQMRPAFHEQATIFGYFGERLVAGPIQGLFDGTDRNGPAPTIRARIFRIDVAGAAANVRLESDNWSGRCFTDLLSLIKIDGQWKIINKAFHLHG